MQREIEGVTHPMQREIKRGSHIPAGGDRGGRISLQRELEVLTGAG